MIANLARSIQDWEFVILLPIVFIALVWNAFGLRGRIRRLGKNKND